MGPDSWVRRADAARRANALLLGAFAGGKVAAWLWTGPYPEPPLDFVTIAIPELVWMVLWAASAVACAVGLWSSRALRWSVTSVGALTFIWGVGFAFAAFGEPEYTLSAVVYLVLAGMSMNATRLSSLMPSEIGGEGRG